MHNRLRFRADSGPMDALTNMQVYAACAMARALRKYDAREMWGSELLYNILGIYLTLPAEDKGIVLEYFRKCGNWKPIQPQYKGLDDHATRNIQTEKQPTIEESFWRQHCRIGKDGSNGESERNDSH